MSANRVDYLRVIFQWGVSVVLLGLALLYLASVAQYFLFTRTPETAALTFHDAGVNFSIAVALFGLAAVNFWVFATEERDDVEAAADASRRENV